MVEEIYSQSLKIVLEGKKIDWYDALLTAKSLLTLNSISVIKKLYIGIPGWRSGLAPAFGPGRDPGDRDPIPRRAPGAWSLLLPLPVSLPLSLSLSVTIINKEKN